jgi:hypothetical protein
LNKAFGAARKEDKSVWWFDGGACERLNLDLDERGLIQTIRLSIEVFNGMHNCALVEAGAGWKTGRGLGLRSACADVSKLYGEANSRSPSTKNGQPLELLYYAFDWAGPDVPQVMEVVCTAPKDGSPARVVEITLAASSL